MAGLVIFQSHSFSLFNTALTVGHLFNIASLFHQLFELGNRHPYRLTRPRNTGNLGNPFESNNLVHPYKIRYDNNVSSFFG